MKQCECGNKTFDSIFSSRVIFTLDDNGILTAIDEENIGGNSIFVCTKCDREYTTSNFKEIITK